MKNTVSNSIPKSNNKEDFSEFPRQWRDFSYCTLKWQKHKLHFVWIEENEAIKILTVSIRDDGCISFINILVSSLSTEKQDYQILHSSNGVIFTHKHERSHAFTTLTVYSFGCFQTVLGAEV